MSDTQKPSGTFGDYSPTNSDAEEYPSFYDVCERTGFKAKRGQLVKEWTGLMVLPDFWEPRHPQDLIRPKGEKQAAQLSPEPEDDFVSTNEVQVSDL